MDMGGALNAKFSIWYSGFFSQICKVVPVENFGLLCGGFMLFTLDSSHQVNPLLSMYHSTLMDLTTQQRRTRSRFVRRLGSVPVRVWSCCTAAV
jgi:hypothetical protein